MALVFEYENDLVTGKQPYISHEKNSTIYNYYIRDDIALDKHTLLSDGDYSNVVFKGEQRSLTTKAVSRIGIKNFPGIGGIGFYKDAYTGDSRIVAPIHIDRRDQKAPVLTKAEVVNNMLHIVITPPRDLEYTCYRIVARQGPFAFEYITYKTDYSVELPTVKGSYDIYCMGYDEGTGAASEDSNIIVVNITKGDPDWRPYITVVDDLTVRIEQLEEDMGDIGAVLDEINGLEV